MSKYLIANWAVGKKNEKILIRYTKSTKMEFDTEIVKDPVIVYPKPSQLIGINAEGYWFWKGYTPTRQTSHVLTISEDNDDEIKFEAPDDDSAMLLYELGEGGNF